MAETQGKWLTRRNLLVSSSVAGSAGVLGVGGLWYSTRPKDGARVLSTIEWEVVHAVCEVLFPAGMFSISGLEAGVVSETDRFVAEVMLPIHRVGFLTILRTLEWGTLASRGTRFSKLDPNTRIEVFKAWADPENLPRRVALDAIRAVVSMAYFAHPDIADQMGWRKGCNA